ncbi:MAG: metalloprotease PmbA [Gammaproteobacteria bacterium]
MAELVPVAQSDLENVTRRILDSAAKLGATAAETSVSTGVGISVNVRLGEVETIEYQRDRSLSLTCYQGESRGSASTGDFSEKAIAQTVEKACSIARFTAHDSAAGLADKGRMATSLPDLSLCHPWNVDANEAIKLATECESAARSFDPRIQNSEGAGVSTFVGTRVYGNSHGFVGGFSTSSHGISCSVLAKDDSGGMERDYWYSSMRDVNDLESARFVGEESSRRAVARLGARKLSTRSAKVLFPARLARGLFGHFFGAISGGAQYRKSTFLLEGKGRKVFPDFVSIREEPHIPKAFGSVPMDGEGVATYARDVVADGVVQDYILSTYSARRLGLETTANAGGIQNMVVTAGTRTEQELIRDMGTGLIVNELIGQGVNPLTGDYSRGAAGFWVENGEIAYPVHEITIAGNLNDMYSRMLAVSSDVDRLSKVHCGAVLLDDLTIAGN